MNCEEIKKIIDDYIDNQLDEQTKSDLEDSLPYCEDQNEYLKKVNSLSKKLNELPLSFDPPKEVISGLTDKLMKLSEVAKKGEIDEEKLKRIDKHSRGKVIEKKKSKGINNLLKDINFSSFTIIISSMAAVLLLLAIYFVTFFNNTAPWKVNTIQGSFKLNNETMASANVDTDDILTTSAHSTARVNIPEEASIMLEPSTSMQILDTKKTLNKISLLSGEIVFNAVSNKPHFELESNGIIIKAEQAQFSAKIDSNGYLDVLGIRNYVEIITPFDRLLLSDEYRCKISGNIIGIPYHKDATDNFKHQLKNIQANINDVVELTSLMYNASYKDAHTLLRLIEKVSKKNRDMIYQKLNNLFPPTPRVTKQGIIDGNKEMLDEWWFEIDWQI